MTQRCNNLKQVVCMCVCNRERTGTRGREQRERRKGETSFLRESSMHSWSHAETGLFVHMHARVRSIAIERERAGQKETESALARARKIERMWH